MTPSRDSALERRGGDFEPGDCFGTTSGTTRFVLRKNHDNKTMPHHLLPPHRGQKKMYLSSMVGVRLSRSWPSTVHSGLKPW